MAQQAPFLGFVQIIVYTGADHDAVPVRADAGRRDSSDSVVEVLRGQRLAALVSASGWRCCSSDWSGRR
jgi:NADH-quinone oxidoreductase subunit J